MIPNKPSIEELFWSFPSLSSAAEIFVPDTTTFQTANDLMQWAQVAKVRLKDQGLQAAYFVALVMNNFEQLPGGAKFDFATAITEWDEQHWTAFRAWVCHCPVSNPNVRPEYELSSRKIDFEL